MPNTFENLKIGTKVRVKLNGELVVAKFAGMNLQYNMPNVEIDGSIKPRKIYEIIRGESEGEVDAAEVTDGEVVETIRKDFDINRRFEFLEKCVRFVATSTPTSLIITGDGGLGKSYTVFEQLKNCGMEKDVDYVVVKGYSTPKSVYRALYDNRDRIIVFDDCDSVLNNDTSVNLLKASLDSSDVRTVSWLTERGGGESEDSMPTRFDFMGKVIFISNWKENKIPQPLRSRALCVDVSMTPDQKLERMSRIAADIKPDLDMTIKTEVIEFLRTLKDYISDLNMRTFLKVCDIRVAEPNDWRDLAEYIVTR